MKHILLLLAFGAGCCLPVQAGINTLLRRFLGEPMQAALVSFAVGTLALWLYSLAARHTWPPLSQLSAVPWWMWTGGILGAIFVSCTIFLAPRLGAATMTAVMLSGQLVASVLLDHFALVGFPEHPVSPLRLVGIGLLFAGAWLVRYVPTEAIRRLWEAPAGTLFRMTLTEPYWFGGGFLRQGWKRCRA